MKADGGRLDVPLLMGTLPNAYIASHGGLALTLADKLLTGDD